MTRPCLAACSRTTAAAACAVVTAAVCVGGCRSAAHEDLYNDKLAAEVRFLEDQLYQIDYENKVLRQKVDRLKLAKSKPGDSRQESVLGLPRRSDEAAGQSSSLRDLRGSGEPETIDPPGIQTPEIPTPDIQVPRVELGQPSVESSDIELPDIDPGIALPPDASELTPPEIDPGSILPPGDARSRPDLQPSRVILPASFDQLIEEPAEEISKIIIDPVYSRGHDFDPLDNQQGIYLVIKALDTNGREVPIESPMQIAIIDPRRKGSESRLGRWAYDIDQVRAAWRETAATDGVHLAIPWKDRPPLGDVVTVYCRIELESGERIRADADIDLSQHRSKVELWTPRGPN